MDANTQAIFATLAAQRNQALDAVAQLNGQIADLNARIAALEATKPSEGPAGA